MVAARGYHDLANCLKQEIVAGKLKPCEQIGSHEILRRRFGSTKVTIQRALDLLQEEGFLRAERYLGTFVAENPPHLTRYAIAFPWRPGQTPSPFFEEIGCQAEALQTPACETQAFYNIDGHIDGKDYQRLERLVLAHRLAGLIFAFNPRQLGHSKLMAAPDLPRVAIMEPCDVPWPTIYPDLESFLARALDHLSARGRCRVALLTTTGREHTHHGLPVLCEPMAAERGMECRPSWIQAVWAGALPWAENLVRLLMESGRQNRPDALIIADDTLIPAVTKALAACGVENPGDMDVVALANWPRKPESAIPICRLGVDVPQLVRECVALVDRQRRGEPVPPSTLLPALFEDEFKNRAVGSLCSNVETKSTAAPCGGTGRIQKVTMPMPFGTAS